MSASTSSESVLRFCVVSRSGRDMGSFELKPDATLTDLKNAFHAKHKSLYPDRQYFTIGADKARVVLADKKALREQGVTSSTQVVFKDLGPQISWSTVFYVEYFGPILVHSLFYFFPNLFYPGHSIHPHSWTQTVAFWLVVAHYVKRELETCFVHRFSHGTMPLLNIFKNSTHYWIFGGAFIAYFLYHPLYTPTKSDLFVNVCAVLMVLCEFGNLYCHIILRNLRPANSTARGIPRGFLFEYTTCANYTCEVFAWLFFALFTQTVTGYFFLLVSTAQIAQWSLKKHVALKKEFGTSAPKRKILFPFIW